MTQLESILFYRANNHNEHIFAYYLEQDKIQAQKDRLIEDEYLEELELLEYEFEQIVNAHNNNNNSFRLFKTLK